MFFPVWVALPDLTSVVSVSSSAYGAHGHTLRVPWLRRGSAGPLRRRRHHEDPLRERRRPLLLPCCLPTARLPAASKQSSPPWSRSAAATDKDYPNSSINEKRVSLLQKGWIGYVSFLLYNYADE
jgi:hypothetical protein